MFDGSRWSSYTNLFGKIVQISLLVNDTDGLKCHNWIGALQKWGKNHEKSRKGLKILIIN